MRKRHLGFTLIEMMVALFIFAIVSMLAVMGLRNVLQTSSVISHYDEQLGNIQLAMILMDRDFSQIANRPVIAENKSVLPAVIGNDHEIEFTHMGYANPLAQLSRGTLQRTAYYVEKHQLIRVTWPVLDRTPDTLSNKRLILSNVESFNVQYFTNELADSTQWPVDKNQPNFLPAALRITITLQNMGSIERVYIISSTNNES